MRWQNWWVVAMVAASNWASARVSRARRAATSASSARGQQREHRVRAGPGGGRVGQPALGRHQPLADPLAQLVGGLPAEGDQHQLGQLGPALGQVAGGQRGDGEGLAGAGAGLQHGGAGRQRHRRRRTARRLVAVTASHSRTTSSASSSGDHRASASVPNRVGSPPARSGRRRAAPPARRPGPTPAGARRRPRSATAPTVQVADGLRGRVRGVRPAGPGPRVGVPGHRGQRQRLAQPGVPQRHQLGQQRPGPRPASTGPSRACVDPCRAAAADGDRHPRPRRRSRSARAAGPRPGSAAWGPAGSTRPAAGSARRRRGTARRGCRPAAARRAARRPRRRPAAARRGPAAAAATSGSTSSSRPVSSASPSAPGGSSPRRHSACRQRSRSWPASRSRSSRSPIAHVGQPVQLDRQRVGRLLGAGRTTGSPTRCRRNPLHRVLEEAHQLVQPDGRRPRPGPGPAGRAGTRRRPLRSGGGQRAGQLGPVEAERPPGGQLAGAKLRGWNGCSGCRTSTPLRGARSRPRSRRAAHRAGPRAGRRAPVRSSAPECTHDQPLGGRAQRVQQQLAVLAARVALADQRVPGQQVVAVGHGRRAGTPRRPARAGRPPGAAPSASAPAWPP